MPRLNRRTGRAEFDTALGRFGIYWRDDSRVLSITLPGTDTQARAPGVSAEPGGRSPGRPGVVRLRDYPAVERLVASIRSVLDGSPARFDLSILSYEACGLFQRAVLEAQCRVPRGRAISYRALAEMVGRPGAARAVGNALADNPFPIVIPCHRTVRSDRGLGGFGGGLRLKRALLELEGIGFDPAGRVRPVFLNHRDTETGRAGCGQD